MNKFILLFSIIPTLGFSQNLIIQQAANPQANVQLVNYENNVYNKNVELNNDVQYMQLNISDQLDNNPVQLADNNRGGGGINLPKVSLPAFAWKPSAAGGGKAKQHKMAKKIFLSKKKFKKFFGRTKKIKASASCVKW